MAHDFATGEGGDQVDFFQRATGLSKKEACRKFIELAGGNSIGTIHASGKPKPPAEKCKPTFPEFSTGTRAEIIQLSELRRISREGLEWASERGLLCFATLNGFPAWIVTDSARLNAQARRMDGKPWEHLDGAKAWTLLGSWASWPIGIKEAQSFPSIALCEGGPDFLAAHYLSLWEQASHPTKRDVRCVPVAMLGASLRIHPDGLPLFAGKQIRIFGHDDDAGRAATEMWARQLQSVGAAVDAFDFAGLHQEDGRPVKDLNDSLLMDAESFSQAERMLP
jgi:hypothetical protein